MLFYLYFSSAFFLASATIYSLQGDFECALIRFAFFSIFFVLAILLKEQKEIAKNYDKEKNI